jgi:hypothetical protein
MLFNISHSLQKLINSHLTSSRTVVSGNSGPYRPCVGSPSLFVIGLPLPYGLPKLLKHTTKNLEVSNALPSLPSSGPHQSETSALPVKAWQMTMALSPAGDSLPKCLYAIGTFRRTAPDSNSKDGTMTIDCEGTRSARGFSG